MVDFSDLQHTPQNFIGGGIQFCIEHWKHITSDPWVLDMVKGVTIDLETAVPVQSCLPRPIPFDVTETMFVRQEIQNLLQAKVIETTTHCPGEFISNIFLRPKKDGSFRMILNLKSLNQVIEYHHFKMDTLRNAIMLMTRNCWFGSVDLKQAYYSVNLLDKQLCRFSFEGQLYQFTCLPNGLSEAPRKFTKIMKVVYSALRKMGHANVGYIDDSLLQGDDYDDCVMNISDTVWLMDSLGFTVHPGKSVIIPTQVIVFLGFLLNSIDMTVRLIPDKARKLEEFCRFLLKIGTITIRQLAELIGRMVASEPGVLYAPLYYKTLELAKDKALKNNQGNFDAYTTITCEMRSHIQWWIDNLHLAYSPVHMTDPDFRVYSDSSDSGWGCSFQQRSAGGQWSQLEGEQHINFKELKAALLALQTFCRDLKDCHVRLVLDNTTAVAYVANMGGKKAHLNSLARDIWLWAIDKNIWLSAEHLPGVLNVTADRASRRKFDDELEWRLDPLIFGEINRLFGPVCIDLFATRINNQVENYVSWRPDPQAIAVDAFTLNWSSYNLAYLFPPFSLLGRILQKIEQDAARVVLIAPVWTTQSWFPKLLRLVTTQPRLLPSQPHLLYLPRKLDLCHPLHNKLRLAAFSLSGIISECKEYRRGLPASSSTHGELPLRSNTGLICQNGFIFVVAGVLMQLSPL